MATKAKYQNPGEQKPLSNNFKGQKPADASAPKIDGGKFTPSTSQSNIRGKQGQ